jgi:hypothetical protein
MLTKSGGVALVAVVALAAGSLFADEQIVLTDIPSDEFLERYRSSPEYKEQEERRSTRKENMGHATDAAHKEMAGGQCAVASTEHLGLYDSFLGLADSTVNQEELLNDVLFGYQPIDQRNKVLQSAQLVGVYGTPETDGFVHEFFYLYDFEDLGLVLVQELSYRTIPDTDIRVTAPRGNVRINGYAGTYTALKDEGNSKGLTGLTFITENKWFHVVAFRCVAKSDRKSYRNLIQIAESLS